MIVISVVMFNLAASTSDGWLKKLSDYRCPITANCLITLSDYYFADQLVQNTAVYCNDCD